MYRVKAFQSQDFKHRLVVVAAASFEIEPTIAALTAQDIHPEVHIAGVSIEAAWNTKELAQKVAGKHVIFVGSAGTFGDFQEPYLVTAKNALWMPQDQRTGQGDALLKFFPAIDIVATPITESLPKVTVLTSPTVSRSSSFSSSFSFDAVECVENMELYHLAKFLQPSSFSVILGITNKVGPEGHSQWVAYRGVAASLSANFIPQMFC